MFVRSVMKDIHNCFYVNKDDVVELALDKLEAYGVDALPILDGEEYVGMVTRPSVYRMFFESTMSKEEFIKNIKSYEVAVNQELVVDQDEVFEHVLVKVKDSPIVAVVDNNFKFKGIVTRYDAIEQFQSAFGMNKPGLRIAFTSIEGEGRIAKLAKIAHQYHEQIISLATFDESDQLVRRIVMKVEKNDNLDKFIQKLESCGFRVLDIKED